MRTAELRVLCEGPTEYNFAVKVLAPHLKAPFGVHARPANLGGVKRFEKLHRALKADIGRARAHQFVTTMLDLYALPKFPGDVKESGISGTERALRIEAEMADTLRSPQFVPYIQVHEFEALLFVDLDQLHVAFPDGEADGVPEQLGRAIGVLAPEDIDDGPATAPSKRLIRALPAYEKSKPIAGPDIAARIGLPRLRLACPHLDQWVEKLERLANIDRG